MPTIITSHNQRMLFFLKKMQISLLKEVYGLIIDYQHIINSFIRIQLNTFLHYDI